MPDLFVQRGLGDLTFFQVHDETVIGADKTDVELLLGLVPLRADHEPVPVMVGIGAGDDRRDDRLGKSTDALEQVRDLFLFQRQLLRVVDVLILAAATVAEVTALRRDTMGRRLEHLDQLRAGELFFDLGEFRLHLLAGNNKRNKHHELIHPAHALAAEGDVGDRQRHTLARRVGGRCCFGHAEDGGMASGCERPAPVRGRTWRTYLP